MSESKPQAQSAAQAGSSGEAAGVGSAVGVLRSSEETPVMGVERRRDAGSGVRGGRGRRLRKEISLYDEKSPTMSVVALVNGAMEPDSESRIREIRSSGLMRGEVEPRNRQLRSVQSARSTSPTLPLPAAHFHTIIMGMQIHGAGMWLARRQPRATGTIALPGFSPRIRAEFGRALAF